MKPGWAKIKGAAEHAGVSVRTVRSWMRDGLRFARLQSGTVLFKYEWMDQFLENFEVKENEVDRIVESAMRDLK